MRNRLPPQSGGSADGSAAPGDSPARRVRDAIAREDPANPLDDEHVAAVLRSQGVAIVRRTVTKLRKELGIASSRTRGRL